MKTIESVCPHEVGKMGTKGPIRQDYGGNTYNSNSSDEENPNSSDI